MKKAILPLISGLAMIMLAARQARIDRKYFEKLEEM